MPELSGALVHRVWGAWGQGSKFYNSSHASSGLDTLQFSQPPWPPGVRAVCSRGGGKVRNFRIFLQFRIFSQFFRNSFLLVHRACLLVPCVSPVQRCCSLRLREVWLRQCVSPQFSRNFPQLDLTLPDRNHPPPAVCVWAVCHSHSVALQTAGPGGGPPTPRHGADGPRQSVHLQHLIARHVRGRGVQRPGVRAPVAPERAARGPMPGEHPVVPRVLLVRVAQSAGGPPTGHPTHPHVVCPGAAGPHREVRREGQ